MESVKHGNSETLIEENDHPEKFNGDNTGTGRSYDCSFCKRGFTNAQALGGHMNIHRKDKAKVKQLTDQSSVSDRSNEDYKYFAPISSGQAHYYASVGTQMNHQTYFLASNPNLPHAYIYHQSDDLPLSLHEKGMGANLSLQIGPPYMADSKEKKKSGWKENEVDLELRLGHDP